MTDEGSGAPGRRGRFFYLLKRRIGRMVRVRTGPAVFVGALARVRLCYITLATARREDRDDVDLVHIPIQQVQSLKFR